MCENSWDWAVSCKSITVNCCQLSRNRTRSWRRRCWVKTHRTPVSRRLARRPLPPLQSTVHRAGSLNHFTPRRGSLMTPQVRWTGGMWARIRMKMKMKKMRFTYRPMLVPFEPVRIQRSTTEPLYHASAWRRPGRRHDSWWLLIDVVDHKALSAADARLTVCIVFTSWNSPRGNGALDTPPRHPLHEGLV